MSFLCYSDLQKNLVFTLFDLFFCVLLASLICDATNQLLALFNAEIGSVRITLNTKHQYDEKPQQPIEALNFSYKNFLKPVIFSKI